MDWKKLTEPFPEEDIEWRIQRSGLIGMSPWALILAYVTSRAVQQRLDDVCGVESWKNEFQPGPDGGVVCGLSIKIGDEWLTKWDGSENTQIQAVKGGLSGAMKRAAVQFGVGRYLYKLPTSWATFYSDKDKKKLLTKHSGMYRDKIPKEGDYWFWNPPKEHLAKKIVHLGDAPEVEEKPPPLKTTQKEITLQQANQLKDLMLARGLDPKEFPGDVERILTWKFGKKINSVYKITEIEAEDMLEDFKEGDLLDEYILRAKTMREEAEKNPKKQSNLL